MNKTKIISETVLNPTEFRVKVKLGALSLRLKSYVLGKSNYPSGKTKFTLKYIEGNWVTTGVGYVIEDSLVVFYRGNGIVLNFNEVEVIDLQGQAVEELEKAAIELGQTCNYTYLCLAIENKKLFQLSA